MFMDADAEEDPELPVAPGVEGRPNGARRSAAGKENAVTPARKETFAEAFLANEALVQRLGRLFAESFAVYTVEVIARLSRQGTDGGRGAAARSGEATTEQVPDWVRQAYRRSMEKGVETETADEVRPNAARNQLVLALRDRGMTQADLARKLGRSPTVISRIFRHPERSRLRTLREIAEALDLDLSDIL